MKTINSNFYQNFAYKNELITSFNNTFKMHGFNEISVPIFQNSNLFRNSIFNSLKDNLITFSKKTDSKTVLQNDITASIAAHITQDYDFLNKPLKLCYGCNIFELNNQTPIEKTQVGIEIYDDQTLISDFEIINLASKALKLSNNNFVLEISDVNFLNGLLADFNETEKFQLIEILKIKNQQELNLFALKSNTNNKLLKELLSLSGNPSDVLTKIKQFKLNKRMEKAIDNLSSLINYLKDYSFYKSISIDLSLISDKDYYSDLIIKGYIENYPKAVLSGGRYDNLASAFNKSFPACGFGIDIDSFMNLKKISSTVPYDILLLVNSKDMKNAFALAEKLRDFNFKVNIESYVNNKERLEKAFIDNIPFTIISSLNAKYTLIDKNSTTTLKLNDTQLLKFLKAYKNQDQYLGH